MTLLRAPLQAPSLLLPADVQSISKTHLHEKKDKPDKVSVQTSEHRDTHLQYAPNAANKAETAANARVQMTPQHAEIPIGCDTPAGKRLAKVPGR